MSLKGFLIRLVIGCVLGALFGLAMTVFTVWLGGVRVE